MCYLNTELRFRLKATGIDGKKARFAPEHSQVLTAEDIWKIEPEMTVIGGRPSTQSQCKRKNDLTSSTHKAQQEFLITAVEMGEMIDPAAPAGSHQELFLSAF